MFLGHTGADDDFVVAVSFEADGTHNAYVVPTTVVADTLEVEHRRWVGGEKRGVGQRKDTPMRSIYIDNRDDGTPSRGFEIRWRCYREAWDTLAS